MPTVQGKLVGDVFTPDSILKKKNRNSYNEILTPVSVNFSIIIKGLLTENTCSKGHYCINGQNWNIDSK